MPPPKILSPTGFRMYTCTTAKIAIKHQNSSSVKAGRNGILRIRNRIALKPRMMAWAMSSVEKLPGIGKARPRADMKG